MNKVSFKKQKKSLSAIAPQKITSTLKFLQHLIIPTLGLTGNRTTSSNSKKKGMLNKLWMLFLLSGGTSLNYSILGAIAPSGALAGNLEFSSGSYPSVPTGPSTADQTATLLENTVEPGTFAGYTPAITIKASISNQQYTNGLTFGDNLLGGVATFSQMDTIAAPANNMFTANPNGPTNTGVSVADNYAFSMFTTVNPLIGQPLNGKYYYADLTLTFSRPVSDPVIHMTGMGGTYASGTTHGHTSEFELITPGITPSKLSGSPTLNVTGNNITNSATTVSAACPAVGGSSASGAACGSVKFTGTNITELKFKVYVRGDGNGPGWATSGTKAGDLFLFGGVSIAKPVTVSGSVLDDANGLTDSSVNGTGSNAGGLFVNLLDSAGKVVASAPVAVNGTYSFSAIGAGQYSVSLSTVALVQGSVAPASTLPSTWINTGEGTSVTGDGTVNGSTAITVAAVNVTGVNFGIERLPDTTDLNPASQTNPGGTATVQVPTLAGTDPEDGALGSGKTFKIVTLPTNGTLTYNGTAVTAGQIISSYNPALLQLDPNDGAIAVSFTYAAIDAAAKEDPTPATVTMPFTAGVAVTPSICSAAGGVLGTNLFADNGSFGTLPGTPQQTTFGGALAPGRTTYQYSTNTGYAKGIDDGQYTIINKPSQSSFRTDGAWHLPYDHTNGSPSTTGLMMLVNASFAQGVFYQETLNVAPNTNYQFSAWIMNILVPAGINPNVALEIDRIGVDDDNNPSTSDGSEGLIVSTTGDIGRSASPTWVNYGAIINSGSATQVIIRLRNNAPGGGGNDLALDDLVFSDCSLPSGNITGTLYRDKNTNNVYNSGTDVTMPANIAVDLKNSSNTIVATAYTNSSGGYSFTNVPVGSNYILEVALTDTDIPSGATATANPSGASTTGIQSGITVTSGTTLANQNFGFSPVSGIANVLLVKRITALNNAITTRNGDELDVYKDDPANPYDDNQITVTSPNPPTQPADTDKWLDPSTFMLGGTNGGNVRPGDEIEYTIYYLSAGDTTANNVLICDRIPENATFVPSAFNKFTTKNTTGLPSGDRGIIWQNNDVTESLTNISDGDTAEYLSPGVDPAIKYPGIKCDGSNTNGVVVVNLGNLPNAIAPGTPTSSYGFIRFRGRIK